MAALVLGLGACTPAEAREWWTVFQRHPVGALRFARCVTARPKAWAHPGAARGECRQLGRQAQRQWNRAHARWVPDTSCSQWAQLALDVGFSKSQWYEPMARIMYRESMCSAGAYNPSGASGLMQVMAGWADDCGGSPSDLFDPHFNLRCARHVYNVQGWGAWSTY